jgi:hypothetical protein
MRNSLVHDVRNSEFSLTHLVAAMDAAALRQFAVSFSPFETFIRSAPFDPKSRLGYGDDMQKAASLDSVLKRARDHPKYHMWLGAYNVLVSIVEMYGYSDYRQWIKAKELLDAADEDDAT